MDYVGMLSISVFFQYHIKFLNILVSSAVVSTLSHYNFWTRETVTTPPSLAALVIENIYLQLTLIMCMTINLFLLGI